MASIRQLQNEHDEVVRRLEALQKEMGALRVGQVAEGSTGLSSMAVFIEKAILPHFSIEERIIFPLLASGSPEAQRLREELLADHLYLKDCFFRYLMGIGGREVTEEFLNLARDMSYRLAAHAKKEDAVLIPLLRRWLQLGNGEPLPEHAPP